MYRRATVPARINIIGEHTDYEGGLSLPFTINSHLTLEVKKSEIKKIVKIIKDEMISVANSDYHSFSIPLTVDINSGDNWGVLH